MFGELDITLLQHTGNEWTQAGYLYLESVQISNIK